MSYGIKTILLPLLLFVQMLSFTTAAFAWPTNVDDATMRSYGYKGNGNSHPLSSITDYFGTNTTGWTATQWQNVLPAAQNTSDEIDGVVINSLIQMAPGAIVLRFGPGQAFFSTPLTICDKAVAIYGSGGKNTGDAATTLSWTPALTSRDL